MVPDDEVPAAVMMVFSGGSHVLLQVLVLAAVAYIDGGSSSGARFAMASSKGSRCGSSGSIRSGDDVSRRWQDWFFLPLAVTALGRCCHFQ
ncbi:hypothetical protein DEO72_LG8g2906 [Vigna unguiculata]|uniref:Uncharacterized protein n=1 Tax=Vigna unguiculata TaxID=3917 RepID=A0A4D6MYA8_VIGUN|nr:hypothetical protein DEO72_LG8g2905 [Vigna unguiculata]QCE04865.1 hypothetical protein DEO72_LG8g2906 [Vigna unguiculata]